MSQKLSYLYGYVYKKNLFYVAAQDDELAEQDEEHTLIFQFEGDDVYEWAVEAESVSLAYLDTVSGGTIGIVICSNGKAKIDEPQGFRWENICTGPNPPTSRRALLASRVIGKNLYATGMLRQVFVRDTKLGRWSRIDKKLLPISAKDLVVGFEDIDGFTEDEIYAVGLKGQIWIYDGKDWTEISSPTNAHLSSLRCAPDGNVYVVGDGGILLQGRGHSWMTIDQDLTDTSFTSVEYAFGAIYIAENGQGLYRYSNGIFSEQNTNLNKKISTYYLHFNDNLLLSVGEKDIVTYDGSHWVRIQDP